MKVIIDRFEEDIAVIELDGEMLSDLGDRKCDDCKTSLLHGSLIHYNVTCNRIRRRAAANCNIIFK